jgi:SIR2-like domain
VAATTATLQALPIPLLDDLATGRWLPIVGAGLSRNAIVSTGEPPLLWEPLAEQLANELSDYTYSRDPVDAISAYEQEHGRNRLVERVGSLLRVHDARPGPVHQAFCQLGFERVVTTNFDMLLERQYEALRRTCLPLVEEAQLSMANPYPGPALLKLHGDVHHPQRLVMTEDDYDTFLRRHPLLATHMASLLIDRTAVLVGYSLSDPDLRQLLSLVTERLGRLHRPLYALLVGADSLQANRFLRRGVKPVLLPGSRQDSASILTDLFEQLYLFRS